MKRHYPDAQERYMRKLDAMDKENKEWENVVRRDAAKRKRKAAKPGRPDEGRVKMTVHVLPLTATRINYLVDKTKPDANTQGKVVDSQFGVRACKTVAGAGRKAPRGQHGRAKQKQSRAKRANTKMSDKAAPGGTL